MAFFRKFKTAIGRAWHDIEMRACVQRLLNRFYTLYFPEKPEKSKKEDDQNK